MGVPALFRWLSKKYPKIVLEVQEEDEPENGRPIDITQANPNGMEYDNLYLDFNGIVHPCTHPEGKPPPDTEEEMMVEIFKYTERLIQMVRPRKLLVIAIDGVAPRAKMNQQRSRRFRTAMDARIKEEERVAAIAEWQSMGRDVSESMQQSKAWDSNAITPGTPFMDLLAASIRYWVARKINTDPGWRDLKVIISDASVPGEGEHKIMDLIRRQRSQPEYDPNTKHVIYGLDADLIMLSLATHEPHFKVLREDVFADDRKRRGNGGCHRCGQPGHHSSNCRGIPKPKEGDFDGKTKNPERKPFIFLDVAVLREYLEIELNVPNTPFTFDLERALDDWVFMIFFVGNDFLPHLPSLDIREGAIDTLLKIWRDNLPKMKGYLTEHGNVNLERAQFMLDGLATREDEIFRKRREAEERQDRGEKRRRVEHQRSMPQIGGARDPAAEYVQVNALSSSVPASGRPNLPTRPATVMEPSTGPAKTPIDTKKAAADNLSAAQRLKLELAGGVPGEEETPTENGTAPIAIPGTAAATATGDTEMAASAPSRLQGSGPNGVSVEARGKKRTADEAGIPASRTEAERMEKTDEGAEDTANGELVAADAEDDGFAPVQGQTPAPLKMSGNMAEQEDTVKLWEPGYKERYYQQKFGIELGDLEFRRNVMKSYVEGLCWVLQYYYQGCPSWHWYYPYHFSPFASDFTDMASLDIKFELGVPVNPIEQLMSVFPAASRQHIPEVFHELMTEPTSEIIDFYPERFHIDMNGKKMIWQGVALLPFIDRPRLLKALEARYPRLTPFEVRRNTRGSEIMFVSDENKLYESLIPLYMGRKEAETTLVLDPKSSSGLFGTAVKNENFIPNSTYDSPLTDVDLEDLVNDRSLSVLYNYPDLRTPHRSVLLRNFKRQRRILTDADADRTRHLANDPGAVDTYDRRGGGSGFHQNRRDIDGVGVSRGAADVYRPRRSSPPRFDDRALGPPRGRSPPPYGRPRSPPPLPAMGYQGRSPPPLGPRRSPPPFLRDSFDERDRRYSGPPPPVHQRFDDRGYPGDRDRDRDYRRDPYDPRYDAAPPPPASGYGGYSYSSPALPPRDSLPPALPPVGHPAASPSYDRGAGGSPYAPSYSNGSSGAYGRDPYAGGYDAPPSSSRNGYGSPYDAPPPPQASPYGVANPYGPPAGGSPYGGGGYQAPPSFNSYPGSAPAPPPPQPSLNNRDALARSLPPHLLAAAGQQRPVYRR